VRSQDAKSDNTQLTLFAQSKKNESQGKVRTAQISFKSDNEKMTDRDRGEEGGGSGEKNMGGLQ
jgi:hypothetical protein